MQNLFSDVDVKYYCYQVGILCFFNVCRSDFLGIKCRCYQLHKKIITRMISMHMLGVCGFTFVCMLMIKDNVVQHNMFTISFYLMCRCYSDTMHEYHHIHNINT